MRRRIFLPLIAVTLGCHRPPIDDADTSEAEAMVPTTSNFTPGGSFEVEVPMPAELLVADFNGDDHVDLAGAMNGGIDILFSTP